VSRSSRRLARSIFHAMVRFGPKLERRQAILGRIVEAGSELFMMTAVCVRAQKLVRENPSDTSPVELADVFCRQSRRRVRASFAGLLRNDDTATYRLAQDAMAGRFAWLEEGVIGMRDTYVGETTTAPAGPEAPPANVNPTPEHAGAD
jgi:ACAD9/ACADV, C-terminal domain